MFAPRIDTRRRAAPRTAVPGLSAGVLTRSLHRAGSPRSPGSSDLTRCSPTMGNPLESAGSPYTVADDENTIVLNSASAIQSNNARCPRHYYRSTRAAWRPTHRPPSTQQSGSLHRSDGTRTAVEAPCDRAHRSCANPGRRPTVRSIRSSTEALMLQRLLTRKTSWPAAISSTTCVGADVAGASGDEDLLGSKHDECRSA